MAQQQVSVVVEQSAYDLGQKVGALIEAVAQKKSLADIAAMELAAIVQIVADVQAVKADLAESKVAFYKGAVLGIESGLEALLA
jgi:hypothetical protein